MKGTRTIAGDDHVLIVMRVKSRDEHGRPKTCEVGFDDTTFTLEQNDEFITAWIPARAVRRVS